MKLIISLSIFIMPLYYEGIAQAMTIPKQLNNILVLKRNYEQILIFKANSGKQKENNSVLEVDNYKKYTVDYLAKEAFKFYATAIQLIKDSLVRNAYISYLLNAIQTDSASLKNKFVEYVYVSPLSSIHK